MTRQKEEKMELHCTLEKDGSFIVGSTTGDYLRYCYPGVDGHALRVLHVEQNEDSILWDTGRGRIGCRVENREKDSFELIFFLEDCRIDIHTLYLMYQADLTAEGFYQAAEGMGKDTGYLTKESLSGKHTVMSYGLCSVNGNGGALTIYQTAQEHYQTVFELRTERKNQYTDGSGQRNEMQQIQLSCGIRMENTGRQNEKFASVKFLYTRTMEEGLERAAKEIGENMSARLAAPPAYHWCSWYYCYHNFDTAQLAEYLQGLQEMKDRPDLKYFQIDAGYFPSAGDWLEVNERFPEGLRSAFARIREAGYVPGIWVGAFMVGNRSRLYREHPDWILYDLAGNPIRPWITDNEPKPWGYQDEEYYCLDTSHPDAMAYMRHVFTTLREWGAGMFKTDFMLWGLQDSSRVKRHTPGKTSVEYFREFLQMIRESIGEESYWLGCIAPFIPFVGYADAMRIAGDVGSAWNGEFGPQNMMRCLTGNNYINHNYFQTDPDAVMLRDFQIRLSEREITSLALLAAVSGSCIYTSDPLHKIAEERRELFRFIEPDGRTKPCLPFLEQERPEIVMVHRRADKGLLFVLNKTEQVLREMYAIEELGLDTGWNLFDLADGKKESLWEERLVVEIPPHGCRLFLLDKENEVTIDRKRLWNNLR